MELYVYSILLVILAVLFLKVLGNILGFSKGFKYMKMKVSDLNPKEQKDVISHVIGTLSIQANIKEPQWMVGNIKGMGDDVLGIFDPEINKIFIDVDRMSNLPLDILFSTVAHEFKHYVDWNRLTLKNKTKSKSIDFWNENQDYYENLADVYGQKNGGRIFLDWIKSEPQLSY